MTIGIDLGTTNSLVCVYRNGHTELIPNELGEYMTNSAVSILEDGTLLIGKAAKERLITHPEQTAASFKRWMGTEQVIRLGRIGEEDGAETDPAVAESRSHSKVFLPHELSALVLKQLYEDARRYLGEEIQEAVISVPAYFDDNQRSATSLAAQLAGVPVKRLINEPSAAGLYYMMHYSGEDYRRLMVIDFGGGTLDVSIVECFENIIEIIAIAGDNRLGGDDIDRAIAEYFCKVNALTMDGLSANQRAALLRQAENAKIALSEEACGTLPCIRLGLDKVYEMVLDKTLLREICEPYLYRMKSVIARAVRDSHLSPEELKDIVLVGGSARLAVLGDFLEELVGKRPVLAGNPEFMVAQGAGICAGIKSRLEGLRDVVMTDVCPFSLGIAVCDDVRDQNPHMATMISRSSMLPASRGETFYTLQDHQTAIRLDVYQGEGYYASENRKIGELLMHVPPKAAGEEWVYVVFSYDINGILHVEAECKGGDKRETVIVNPKVRLGDEELQRKVQELKNLRFAAHGSQEDMLYIAKAERLYMELIGKDREQVAEFISRYRQILRQADLIERKRMRNYACEKIQEWESMMETELWCSDIRFTV
jgi:molecular chaperone HscC